ncbi:MAG: hypothetical protein ACI9P7_002536 [Candidatus Azotimanducaceae bacterium]|jgi:hypothetical protein
MRLVRVLERSVEEPPRIAIAMKLKARNKGKAGGTPNNIGAIVMLRGLYSNMATPKNQLSGEDTLGAILRSSYERQVGKSQGSAQRRASGSRC